MTYTYPGVDFGERYQGARWWWVYEKNIEHREKFSLVDCSTSKLLCAMTFNRLFVVPRGPISIGARYMVNGGQIDTEGYFPYAGDVCMSALFISDCRSDGGTSRASNPGNNLDTGDCRSNGWGQRIMYVYDREMGIIAYEPADYWKLGTGVSGWDLSTIGTSAKLLTLVEDFGLLSCESSS